MLFVYTAVISCETLGKERGCKHYFTVHYPNVAAKEVLTGQLSTPYYGLHIIQCMLACSLPMLLSTKRRAIDAKQFYLMYS